MEEFTDWQNEEVKQIPADIEILENRGIVDYQTGLKWKYKWCEEMKNHKDKDLLMGLQKQISKIFEMGGRKFKCRFKPTTATVWYKDWDD